MMKLTHVRHHLWRNSVAATPVLTGDVSLAEASDWTVSRLTPPLLNVVRREFSTVGRNIDLSSASDLIAAIALLFQLEGDVIAPLCGTHSRDPQTGLSRIFFSCMDPQLGEATLEKAVQIANRLVHFPAAPQTVATVLATCKQQFRRFGLYITTRQMIVAAERRGIPWRRTSSVSRYATLGQGFRQQFLYGTVPGNESAIGREISKNKFVQLNILSQICLPIGTIFPVRSVAQALQAAKHIGFPLVLKPMSGSAGKLVFVNLRSENELRAILEKVSFDADDFLLQSYFPGDDHRMLVVDGKLVSAALKIPAAVIGDGRHTITELAEIENRNPLRVHSPMKEIALDEEAVRVLAQQGLAADSVPQTGRRVYTRGTSNISTGGSAIDVTGRVHPDNASVAVRAAKALQLTVAGVDFICPDISRSWHETGGGICEVNSFVGTRPHQLGNPAQHITGAILETIYPAGDDGRIPTAMVTGTMGKTTTCCMLSSILTSGGHVVGMATTEGVAIGGEMIAPGDMAGPKGHAIALCDPTVTAAILETARGALLRRGTYLEKCDVAALTNVEREHIGTNGIENLDELAALKRKVLDAARNAVVLNAEDPHCLALAAEFSPRIRTILYARTGKSAAIGEHLQRGGEAVFLAGKNDRETIIVAKGSEETPLVQTRQLPATAGGIFWPQATNAMTATALAMRLGIALATIVEGLLRYGKEFPAVEGRFRLAEGFPMPLLFDYATFPPGFAVMSPICDDIAVGGKRICVVTLPGNRPDWQFAACAAELVGHFDLFVCFERDDLLRGVPAGKLSTNLGRALVDAGVHDTAVHVVRTIDEAARIVARVATAQDFVAVFAAGPRQDQPFRTAFRERQMALDPA